MFITGKSSAKEWRKRPSSINRVNGNASASIPMIPYLGAALPAGPRGARGREKEEEREERKESPQEKVAALEEAAFVVATEEDFRELEGSRRRKS